MRQNTLKEILQEDKTAYGVSVIWPSVHLVEFLGLSGFDFIMIDAQHGYFDPDVVEALCRACDISGMIPVVRVPDTSRATIVRFMDAGVMGIMAPHVATAEEAQAIVNSTRFGGRGFRSAASQTRRANYGTTQSFKEFLDWNNSNIFVQIMIEDQVGLSNLEKMLEIDGVDLITFGPRDMALDLGYEGDPSHPEVQKVINEATEIIRTKRPGRLKTVHATALLRDSIANFLPER